MKVEQYVMAYGAEQDRLRALLPEGFVSLRPVLRINAEIRDEKKGYLELNTPVKKDGNRGWLNVGFWEDVPFEKEEKNTYPKEAFTVENAAKIPCARVLGAYMVKFER